MATYLDNLAKKINTQNLAIQAEAFEYDEDELDGNDIASEFDINEISTEEKVNESKVNFTELSASEKRNQYLAELDNPAFYPTLTDAQRKAELIKIEAKYEKDLALEKSMIEDKTAVEKHEKESGRGAELDARESLHAFELDAFNKEKKSKLQALNAAYFKEETALIEKHREETGKTLEGSLKRSLLQSRQIGERLTLKDTFESQSAAIESVQFPDYETWELADYKSGTHFGELASANSKRLPIPTDIRAFKSKEIKGEVAYYKAEFLKRPRVNFADDGHKVKVYLVDDEQTILAALQLASQKELGKPFDIKGSKSFCELCQSVALAHGIAIKTPEIVGSKTVQKTQLIESESVAEPVH